MNLSLTSSAAFTPRDFFSPKQIYQIVKDEPFRRPLQKNTRKVYVAAVIAEFIIKKSIDALNILQIKRVNCFT